MAGRHDSAKINRPIVLQQSDDFICRQKSGNLILNRGSFSALFKFRTIQSGLSYRYITLTRSMERPTDSLFLRAEYFYNVASNIDEFDRHGGRTRMLIERYDGKPLHEHSHSESFLSLVEHRFDGHRLYILSAAGADDPVSGDWSTGYSVDNILQMV